MFIERKGSEVIINVDMVGFSVNFVNDRGSEFDAECVQTVLDDRLRDAIREARMEAYESGYSDGKRKQKKRDYHKSCLDGI